MKPARSLAMALAVSLALVAALVPAAMAQDGPDIDRRPVEDSLFGVASVVPEDWQDLGGGLYGRGTPPDDLAIIAIQSAPATVEQVWSSLLPQYRLDATPDATGELITDRFDWTLHRFDATLGEVSLTVELALAEDDGATHVVLLQSEPADFEVLREQVLLPALEAFDVLAPEPTADAATLGYAVEGVSFPGGSDGVELAGTLTLPAGPGPHPAIVLMSGSGAQDRDESLRPVATIKPFALIADALTSAGIAVLRYDDRGVGESTGDYGAATIAALAADGGAAVEYLRGRDDIDSQRIGLLGHSEGGLYAAMLAAQDPGIAFVVGMAAPAVDGVSVVIAQNEAILRAAGEPEEEVDAAVAFATKAMPLARDGDEAALRVALAGYYGGLWDRQSDRDHAILGDREAFVDRQAESLLSTYLSDAFRSFLAYDPAPDWPRVSVPVLGLFGANDVQVVADQNEPALREALERDGGTNLTVVVFPDANHLFQASKTGAVAEYATLAPEFTADFLPTLVDWVTAQAGLVETP